MTDPTTTSKNARESLARGLNALQGDPSVPAHLVELAAPIAQSMGALHQIEKTGQLAPHADLALGHLRTALAALQAAPPSHAAVAMALDAVASSLGLVHQLSKMVNGSAAVVASAPAPAPAVEKVHTAAMEAAKPATVAAATSQPAHAPQPPPPGYPQPAASQQAYAQQAAPLAGQSPQAQRDPFAAPDPFATGGRSGHVQNAPAAQGSSASPIMPVPAPPAGNLQLVNADLGAHSPTNFYKGLSGNDIVDHGGLFVSTYVPPKIGTRIRLKVSLPGGYEFEANALVKWVREEGGDAPPGFGAQFTDITNEARQLIYRYVRNREPLFYDDL